MYVSHRIIALFAEAGYHLTLRFEHLAIVYDKFSNAWLHIYVSNFIAFLDHQIGSIQ